MLFLRGFILKPTERAEVVLKNSASDFQNSPPFEKSACFYVTITWKNLTPIVTQMSCHFSCQFNLNENKYRSIAVQFIFDRSSKCDNISLCCHSHKVTVMSDSSNNGRNLKIPK